MLTLEKKAYLVDLAEKGQAVQAIQSCIEACEDYLVAKLLERGGFGTLQLNEPDVLPRIQFVDAKKTHAVHCARIGGTLISRDQD